MKKNTKVLFLSVLVILILSGFIVFKDYSRQPRSLVLGLMLPLSGSYAVAGQNYQKGVELALDQYQALHPEALIRLVVEDDGFEVKKGLSAYKKLTDFDHVDAIMMLSTPVIDAIYQDVVKSGIPVMQLGIQTVGIAPDNVFQLSPSGDAPIAEFAEYLEKNYTFSRVAVFYDNSAAGLSFFNAFKNAYGGNFAPFIVNTKADLRSYATKVASDKYDAVIFLTSPENGALGVKEILAVDSTPPFFGFDAQLQTGFSDYGRILGDTNKLNGARSLWLKSGDANAFQTSFQAKYGEKPGFIADFGYDIFNTLIEAYAIDDVKWVSNIQAVSVVGVSGPLSFDENGVRIQPIVINEVKGGAITPVQ